MRAGGTIGTSSRGLLESFERSFPALLDALNMPALPLPRNIAEEEQMQVQDDGEEEEDVGPMLLGGEPQGDHAAPQEVSSVMIIVAESDLLPPAGIPTAVPIPVPVPIPALPTPTAMVTTANTTTTTTTTSPTLMPQSLWSLPACQKRWVFAVLIRGDITDGTFKAWSTNAVLSKALVQVVKFRVSDSGLRKQDDPKLLAQACALIVDTKVENCRNKLLIDGKKAFNWNNDSDELPDFSAFPFLTNHFIQHVIHDKVVPQPAAFERWKHSLQMPRKLLPNSPISPVRIPAFGPNFTSTFVSTAYASSSSSTSTALVQAKGKSGTYIPPADKFACQKGVGNAFKHEQYANHNSHITDIFEELAGLVSMHKNGSHEDHGKLKAYQNAVIFFKTLSYKVDEKSWERAKVDMGRQRNYSNLLKKKKNGVGNETFLKIEEIVHYGKCEKLKELRNNPKNASIRDFIKIFGVGAKTADRMYETLGVRNMTDVREISTQPAGKAFFSERQMIGINYYDEIQMRIPRTEVKSIFDLVVAVMKKINPDVEAEVCGSYRRGKCDSGDIDVLVGYPRPPGFGEDRTARRDDKLGLDPKEYGGAMAAAGAGADDDGTTKRRLNCQIAEEAKNAKRARLQLEQAQRGSQGSREAPSPASSSSSSSSTICSESELHEVWSVNIKKFLHLLIEELTKAGILTDHLSGHFGDPEEWAFEKKGGSKYTKDNPSGQPAYTGKWPNDIPPGQVRRAFYMGIAVDTSKKMCDRTHRRIDIKVYAKPQLPCALLYFTGSDIFNRSMRLFAKKIRIEKACPLGYTLNDTGLYPKVGYHHKGGVTINGLPLRCENEQEVFARLGLKYVKPTDRSCWEGTGAAGADAIGRFEGMPENAAENAAREEEPKIGAEGAMNQDDDDDDGDDGDISVDSYAENDEGSD